jgi:hypothetical protein
MVAPLSSPAVAEPPEDDDAHAAVARGARVTINAARREKP